ncbi:tgb1 [Candida jiufengensis]|uniref:tgb1 n=1 Tax=Candida jiufengensis TaxID=497108 RepID=UPI002225836C|nr:tgb1 [Candida jiufengensis]KAI5951919.1 tgb1 [Candida jiufengensis]
MYNEYSNESGPILSTSNNMLNGNSTQHSQQTLPKSLQHQQLQQKADFASISKQIELAKVKAKQLYDEIIVVKKKTQDTNLKTVSINVNNIPRDSCKLKLYNNLKGHQNKIGKICWNTNSTKILSASQDGYMILWDAITGYKKQAIQLDNNWVLTCSLSPDEKLVASAGLDNHCTIYKIQPDNLNNPVQETQQQKSIKNTNNSYQLQTGFYQSIQSIFKGHTAYISECEFIDNNSIVTGSGDMTCSLWDITKGSKIRDFIDHVGDVLCLSVFPKSILENNLFLSGSSDGYVKCWDLRSPTSIQSFSISNSDVNCVKIFPDGNAFATGSDDGMIRLFDLRSDCEISYYSLQQEIKNSFVNGGSQIPQLTSPPTPIDKKTYQYGNNYTSLQQQQQQSQSLIYQSDIISTNGRNSIYSRNSILENSGIFSIDFSKSGRLLYSCYSDHGCVVWDTLKNEIIGSLGSEHLNKINKVAVSPDGIGLATGSWDSTIKIWSV